MKLEGENKIKATEYSGAPTLLVISLILVTQPLPPDQEESSFLDTASEQLE